MKKISSKKTKNERKKNKLNKKSKTLKTKNTPHKKIKDVTKKSESNYTKQLNLSAKSLVLKNALAKLKNKKVFITGATGMIGSAIVDLLLTINDSYKVKVFAAGRSLPKLKGRFKNHDGKKLTLIKYDVVDKLKTKEKFDYIIHAASNSDPTLFKNNPVETFTGNIFGTFNLLEYVREHKNCKFLYVSSGEMYGQPDEKTMAFTEDFCGYVDYADSRSCYPAGKRGSEVLIQSYIDEHKIFGQIVRPCHIFGPTMTNSDTRAISSFIRDAKNKRDIVLKSKGTLVRSHCYVVDAAAAIIKVITSGKNKEAYNIADEKLKMSVKEFAQAIADVSGVKLVFDIPKSNQGFSKVKRAVLSQKKLKSIGWKSTVSLKDSILASLEGI